MEVSRSATLRENERIKHIVAAITAWANALIIGGFAKMGVDTTIELFPALWIVFGTWLIWMASLMLTLMKAEGEL